jgi:hypothetical protein
VPAISFGGIKKALHIVRSGKVIAGTCEKLPVFLFRGIFITASIIFVGSFRIACILIAGTSKSAAKFF